MIAAYFTVEMLASLNEWIVYLLPKSYAAMDTEMGDGCEWPDEEYFVDEKLRSIC